MKNDVNKWKTQLIIGDFQISNAKTCIKRLFFKGIFKLTGKGTRKIDHINWNNLHISSCLRTLKRSFFIRFRFQWKHRICITATKLLLTPNENSSYAYVNWSGILFFEGLWYLQLLVQVGLFVRISKSTSMQVHIILIIFVSFIYERICFFKFYFPPYIQGRQKRTTFVSIDLFSTSNLRNPNASISETFNYRFYLPLYPVVSTYDLGYTIYSTRLESKCAFCYLIFLLRI